MKFRISTGKELKAIYVPRTVRVVLALLDGFPDGLLITTRELAIRVQRSYESMTSLTPDPALRRYRHLIQRKLYWGNRKTIKAARKELV
jgi:hypothetical protein